MMGFLYAIFLLSMLFGQVGGIVFSPGVVVYIHDFVLCFVLLATIVIKRGSLKKSKLIQSIGIFAGVCILSLILQIGHFSINELATSSLYLWRWLAYAGVYFFIVQKTVSIKTITHGLYLFGVGMGIIGLVQFVFYPDLRNLWYLGWDPHYYRLFSSLLDPNFTGILLAFSVLLGVYLWQEERKYWHIACIVMLSLSLYLTYSRSSYLAILAGIFVYFLLQRQWKIFIVIGLIVAGIIFIPTPGGKTLRLDRWDSTISRIMNWQESFSLFTTSPILGHGFNTIRAMRTPSFSRAGGGVDSSILFLLVTTGVVGLSAYLWLLYKAIPVGKSSSKNPRAIQLYFSILAAVGIHSLFTNSLFYPWVMLWLWIIIGVVEITYDS